MFTNISIKVVVLRNAVNSSGEVPIYLQFIRLRKVDRIPLHKWVPLQAWVGKRPDYLDKKQIPNGKLLNHLLESHYLQGEKIVLEAEINKENLTFALFKERFTGKSNTQKKSSTLETYHHLYVSRQKKRNIAENTLRTYVTHFNRLTKYNPNLDITDFTEDFLLDFNAYLRDERKYDINSIAKTMQYIQALVKLGIRNKIITTNPFDLDFKIQKLTKKKEKLTVEEVNKLEHIYHNNVLKPNLQETLRQFLFACHTGLAWGDIKNLEYEDIQSTNILVEGNQEQIFFIEKNRAKGHLERKYLFITPVLPQALRYIDITQKEGLVFKVIENTKTNYNLREICRFIGTKRKYNFHLARHTFGTLAVNRGVQREAVQKAFGHTKPDMTDHYAELQRNYILEQFQKNNR